MKKANSKLIQDELNKLDSWGKGEVMLLTAFLPFTDQQMDMVKNGVALMFGWHQNQHPNFKRCEKCEAIERLVIMYQMIEELHTTSKKKR